MLGFNLLELMVSVLIMSILCALGVYAFSGFAQRTRALAVMNELYYHLAFARSEAIKRNHAITLCASNDEKSCVGEFSPKGWSHGWIMLDEKDKKLLLVHPAIPKGDELYFKGGAVYRQMLYFTPQGLISDNASSFSYCPSGLVSRATKIILNRLGRPYIKAPD